MRIHLVFCTFVDVFFCMDGGILGNSKHLRYVECTLSRESVLLSNPKKVFRYYITSMLIIKSLIQPLTYEASDQKYNRFGAVITKAGINHLINQNHY